MTLRDAARGSAGTLGFAALFASACVGQIGAAGSSPSQPGHPDHPDGGAMTADPGTDGGSGPTYTAFAPATSSLRKLSVAQYQNSLRDLLGSAITLPTDLEADTALNGFVSVGDARISVSPHGVAQYETAALGVAHQALADAATRRRLVSCTPSGTTDDACARTALTAFGLRAWRRPLTDAEVSRYVTVAHGAATSLHDFYGGIEYAVAGLLESPFFIYRVELGTDDPSHPGWRRYDDYEMASRLSFMFWNTTPDDTLLQAAQTHALTNADDLRAQATRLLADSRAHPAVANFFVELFGLDDLGELQKDSHTYPQMSATMGASMRGETLAALDDLIFARDADYRDLFDTTTTFVNAELARLYGLPAVSGTGFVRVDLPADGPRSGIMGQAGILALNAHAASTSPTYRGRFIRQVLLCQEIPPPPSNVNTSLPDPTTGGTMRQRLAAHQTEPSCAGCHTRMDPLGLGLENFDGIGAYRTTENSIAIDASGDLDGMTFTGPRQLATLLRQHDAIGSCVARKVYRYATGHIEGDTEEGQIASFAQHFATGGYRFRTLLVDVASSDGFRYATAAP